MAKDPDAEDPDAEVETQVNEEGGEEGREHESVLSDDNGQGQGCQ